MSQKLNDKLFFWLFLSPALLTFIIIVIIPFFMGLYYSLTDWTAVPGEPVNFVGFANYTGMLDDPQFVFSLVLTFGFAFASMLIINAIALMLAILVTKKIPLRNFFRAGFFIPNLIGGLVLGYIWQFIYKSMVPEIGVAIGSETIANLLILADPVLSNFGVIFAYAWQYSGYIMMIYIAALLNIPKELIEASGIDGANAWQKFIHITCPMIAQAFTITSFLTLTTSFKQYDIIVALTGGGPSAMVSGNIINTTELLAVNVYNIAFKYNQMGQGQARAIIFFLILVTASLIQVYINKRREVEM